MSSQEQDSSKTKPDGCFDLMGINCLVFNKDFTQCALTKKDKTIYLYSIEDIMKPETWKCQKKLETHSFYVSCLDWHPETNNILSCSYDKTMYVWKNTGENWETQNIVATTKLGFLTCKWNKRGDKFCAGTSAKHLFIGYFDSQNNWWATQNIKGHKASVTCCDIDSSSLFVISGSADKYVYVSSCYLPQVDDQFLTPETKPMAQKFGNIIYKFKPDAWLNSVTFTPDGAYGIAASQNAIIGVLDFKKNKQEVIRCKHSAISVVYPYSNEGFYAIGYDRHIYDYVLKDGKWEIKRLVTEENEKLLGVKKDEGEDDKQKGKTGLVVRMKKSPVVHPSFVTSVAVKGNEMITTDVAGFLKYWKL